MAGRGAVSQSGQVVYSAHAQLNMIGNSDIVYILHYLHSIGVTSDDHLERRRRFDVLLGALVDRVEVA